ncbi:MAG: 23S ribosomal RNA methyltransferase Erm [Lachnospiraceae bacterium]|nr:23S ribosomal RNA methyltransferase Erm [Lachnospiraceae bacterium]
MQKDRRQAGYDYVKQVSDSQNFLTDARLIHRIIRLADMRKEDTVLEIGTGKGHLTEELCRRAGKVCSVEIDKRLMESAKKRLLKHPNVELVLADFMKYRLPEKGTYRVFANIPFFLTTQIVEKLASGKNPPTDMWLVMEKGAAKRFMGLPKETKKSLELKVWWEMKIVYHFRREDFHPKPSVDAVLVHFARKAVPDLDRKEYREFQRFIERAMKYGMTGKGGPLTKRQVSAALKQAGLYHAHEDGVTLYIQWLCLFRCYQGLYGIKKNS